MTSFGQVERHTDELPFDLGFRIYITHSCKEFNARTQHLEPDTPTPVIITIQPDRTFKFDIHTPPTSWLIKQAAGMEKGTTSPPAGMRVSEAQAAGTISLKHVYEIARVKAKDNRMKLVSLESIAKSVIGTCKSMGAFQGQPCFARPWLTSCLILLQVCE